MSDQSRVEAVRAALRWARYRGLSIDDELTAQAAIEASDASDAWLAEQGCLKPLYTCGKCGDAFEMQLQRTVGCSQCDGTRTLSFGEVEG